MSHRKMIALVASTIVGIGCMAMISTDALAYRGGGRVGVGRVGVHDGGSIMAAFIVARVYVRIGRRWSGCRRSGVLWGLRGPTVRYYPYPACY